jgi:hypothetical protein
MREKKSRPIRNGAIAAIIAGILLSFWPTFRNWIYTLLKWCWSALTSLGTLLTDHFQIPGWLILILLLLAFPSLIKLFTAIKRKKEPGVFDLYRRDNLFGAIWEWSYNGNQILNIWCLCPICQSELIYEEHRQSRLLTKHDDEPDNTKFICEKCQEVRVKLNGLTPYALGTVKREIHRKIRTGEWKKAVKANSSLDRDAR